VVPLAVARRSVLVLQNPNYFGAGPSLTHNRRLARRAEIAACHASVRRAARVLAISESLASDVRNDVRRRRAPVTVLQSGAPTWADVARRPAGLAPAIAAEGSPAPLLALANDAPHKGLDLLVGAWAGARHEGLRAPLLLVGAMTERRAAQLRRLVPGDDLHLLGPLHDRGELRWLLEHAAALVAPSLLEAHPLTPAEAGALGCPLVLSDIAAHREVAGEHATYVSPGDVAALRTALLQVGAERRPAPWTWPVTWEDNAAQLADVLRSVAREVGAC
jgi:glycosyltransferase involved in cell wall biosynthesis